MSHQATSPACSRYSAALVSPSRPFTNQNQSRSPPCLPEIPEIDSTKRPPYVVSTSPSDRSPRRSVSPAGTVPFSTSVVPRSFVTQIVAVPEPSPAPAPNPPQAARAATATPTSATTSTRDDRRLTGARSSGPFRAQPHPLALGERRRSHPSSAL